MGGYANNLTRRLRASRTGNAVKLFPSKPVRSIPDKVTSTRDCVVIEEDDKVMPLDKERLVSVAIKRGDVIHKEFQSHAELRRSLGDKNPYEPSPGDISGFWTSADRFLLRHQANRVGYEAGQCQLIGREFLSDDVDKW